MLIFFFFFKEEKGKKQRQEEKKKSVAECPKDHAGGQDGELLSGTASWAPLPGRGVCG